MTIYASLTQFSSEIDCAAIKLIKLFFLACKSTSHTADPACLQLYFISGLVASMKFLGHL